MSEIDYGYLAHRAAEERLAVLSEAVDAELEDYDEIVKNLDPPLEFPYCGCGDCEIREILTAAWPFMRRAARVEAGLSPDD